MLPTSQALLIVWAASSSAAGGDEIHFDRDIRPILSDRCFHCHGPDETERKRLLRLDRADGEDGAYRTFRERTAIVPGDPERSEVWRRISSRDPAVQMPPPGSGKKPLDENERALIERWIYQGAAYREFWAFVPPSRPSSRQTDSREGFIDDHVRARHEREGKQFSREADRRTLIRRVSFDLTGLPPSLQEIDAFLRDDSATAYEEVVDRLLEDPQYGEHMARYWADLVRLGDTAGMHKDFPRDFSTYRDWLIRAFNDNLSFDEFLKYQLAGDLYPEPTRDQLVASGFNRLHLIIDRGTALPEESHHKNVLDRVQAFGTVFLALTVQCAQCHDHKYDPISQREFYQLYAFFNNFDGNPETNGSPPRGLQPPFINLTTPMEEATLAQLSAEEVELQGALEKAKSETAPEKAKELEAQLAKKRNDKGAYLRGLPGAMVMREKATPRTAHFLMRGAYDAPGEVVSRGTPSILPPLKPRAEVPTRMDLAEWLVGEDHPLTARVAVNRFWQQFFGVGLVKTSEDFGVQGEWPSHPELLDDLALHFMESGWDVKSLIRHIVLSKTYRQSSDSDPEAFRADPENRLLARGSRFRMDAEMIRDQILFVSGKLNPAMYGRSVKPPQPPGLWKAVSMAAPLTYVADKGEAIYRRSFYTHWRRGMPPPQMTILNAPSREFCAARRERTNTPLQALLLMNEPEFFKAARSCAMKTLEEAQGDEKDALSLIYEKVTSHRPSPDRLAFLQEALNEFRALYGADDSLARELTEGVEASSVEERASLAAWTMVTHGLFNLELAKVRR